MNKKSLTYLVSGTIIVLTAVTFLISTELGIGESGNFAITLNLDDKQDGKMILLSPDDSELFQRYGNVKWINSYSFKTSFNIDGIPVQKPETDDAASYGKYRIVSKPELSKFLDETQGRSNISDTVFVIPVFTNIAYNPGGFYEYYNKKCDSCTTTSLKYNIPFQRTSSDNAIQVLRLLGYSYITDIDIDKNPDILSKYNKVIVLHNEYVTKKEFDAITNHPNVLYLYPNALYAEINVDYDKDTMTLIRGHNYPEADIGNGFDWEFENTHPYEDDKLCEHWELYEIKNGKMLNCYPEFILYKDIPLLKAIIGF